MSGATASHSLAAQMVRRVGTALPTSFNGDGQLYALNLFLMSAFMCLGFMVAAGMARALWTHRRDDRLRHPAPSGGAPGCWSARPRSCAAARRR